MTCTIQNIELVLVHLYLLMLRVVVDTDNGYYERVNL